MSGAEPEALVAAPVGRAVLAELIGIEPLDLRTGMGRPTPAGTVRLRSTTARADRRADQGARARHHRDAADVIGSAVAEVDLSQVAGCDDRLLLLSVVARVIEGHQADAAAALAAARNVLLPVAQALAAAPAAGWWWQPVDRSAQRWVGADGAALPRGNGLTEAVRLVMEEEEKDEERERSRAVRSPRWPLRRTTRRSVAWWSAPLGGTVFTTTGPIDRLPALELGCVADSAGEEQLEVWAVEIGAQARIREIGGPEDWSRLVSEFPRDVTGSRQYDWNSWTGEAGPWVLPDWTAVARDWDGVHLSVAGFLTASVLPVAAGNAATLLAGWEPDRTLWLNDAFTKVDYVGPWRGTPGSAALPEFVLPWLRQR